MKPLLLFMSFLLLAASATAQQVRLDSLLHALEQQPKGDAMRPPTLIALSETYATIKPAEGLAMAEEAMRIARQMKDAAAEADALNGKATCLFSLGHFTEADSLLNIALSMDRKLGRSHAIALDLIDRCFAGVYLGKAGNKELVEEALRLLSDGNDQRAQADAHWWSSMLGYDEAIQIAHLDTALHLYQSVHDTSGIARCVGNTAYFPPVINDPQRAIANRKEAIRLYKSQGNLLGQEWDLVNLGTLQMYQADYAEALDAFLKARKISEAMGDLDVEAACLGNIGELYLELNDHEQALGYYRQVLHLPLPKGDRHLGALLSLGDIHVQAGRPDSALFYLDRARTAYPELPNNLSYANMVRADALTQKDDPRGALTNYLSAIAIDSDGSDALQLARSSLGAGRVIMSAPDQVLLDHHIRPSERSDKARYYFAEALRLAQEQGLLRTQQDALFELSRLAESAGNVPLALRFHQRYSAMKDSVLNADKSKAVSLLAIQYETEKKEQRIVLLGKDKEVQAKEIQKQKLVRNGFMGGFVLVALFAGVFLFQRNRIGKEKTRSEELLLNILPEEVAEELKAKGEAEARHIDFVTVLFTDFKGFTAMSEQLTPKELVRDIHECFSAFDRICEKHGIEKIKTIGDAYMAAGGLPTPNTTHALDMVKVALEIRDFIAEGKTLKIAKGLPYFEIRIGVHTGPVVAGIVGVKKFAYDIWGDTVNIASRMESSGEVGQVNISEATYALVKDAKKVNGEWEVVNGRQVKDAVGSGPSAIHHSPSPAFTFTPRGKVQAKGKGEMEMYFVSRNTVES